MSAKSPTLSSIQKWFQTFIVEPGDARAAVRAAQATSGLQERPEDLILPSRTLAPLQRLMIYRDQYLLRMEEALSIDFPVLKQHLGDEAFFQLVEAFVQVHPSQSYTLNELGRPLPGYVLKAPGLKKRTLLHDLCRVEWEMSAVLEFDEVEPVSPKRLQSVPPDAWANARVGCIPTLRLLELKYPVQEWLKAHNEERALEELGPKPTWLMIWRTGGDTWRMPLSRPFYEFLARLQAGLPVGQAMDEVLARRRVQPMALFESFSGWLVEGLFSEVHC